MRGNGFAFTTAPIHNPDAEILVLGAMIVCPEARARIGDLHPECFFNLQLRRAFEVVSARIAAGGLVDPITLRATFAQDPDLGPETHATNAIETLETRILPGFKEFSSATPGALGPTGSNASRERPAYHLRNLALVFFKNFKKPLVSAHRILRNPRWHP